MTTKSRDVLIEMCQWRKEQLGKVLKVAREQQMWQGAEVLKESLAAVVEAEKELREEKGQSGIKPRVKNRSRSSKARGEGVDGPKA